MPKSKTQAIQASDGASRKPTILSINRKKMIVNFKSTWIRNLPNNSNAALASSLKTQECKYRLLKYLSKQDPSITRGDVDRWIRTHSWITEPGAHVKGLDNSDNNDTFSRNTMDDLMEGIVNSPTSEFQRVPPPPSTFCDPGHQQEVFRNMRIPQTSESDFIEKIDVVVDANKHGLPFFTSQNLSPLPEDAVTIQEHENWSTFDEYLTILTDESRETSPFDLRSSELVFPAKSKNESIFFPLDNPGSQQESLMQVEVTDSNPEIPVSYNNIPTDNGNQSGSSLQDTSRPVTNPYQSQEWRQASSGQMTSTIPVIADQQPGPSSSTATGYQCSRNRNVSFQITSQPIVACKSYHRVPTPARNPQCGIRSTYRNSLSDDISKRSSTGRLPPQTYNGYQGKLRDVSYILTYLVANVFILFVMVSFLPTLKLPLGTLDGRVVSGVPQIEGGLPPFSEIFRPSLMLTYPPSVTGIDWLSSSGPMETPFFNQLLGQTYQTEQKLEILNLTTMSFNCINQQYINQATAYTTATSYSTSCSDHQVQ